MRLLDDIHEYMRDRFGDSSGNVFWNERDEEFGVICIKEGRDESDSNESTASERFSMRQMRWDGDG